MAGNRKKAIIQFIKFAVGSMANTIIEEGTYILLTYVGLHYIPAYFIGFTLGIVNAYFWNTRLVFKANGNAEKRVWWIVFGKTYLIYATSLLINLMLLFMWMDIFMIERYFTGISTFFLQKGLMRATPRFVAGTVASTLDMLLTFPLNYFVNKKWAYKQTIGKTG